MVYSDADLLDLDISCGVTDEHDLLSLELGGKNLNATSAKSTSGVNGRTELGIDADSTYFALFGSTPATIAAIEERMNIVDYVYRDQVGICYEITGIIVRTTSFAP